MLENYTFNLYRSYFMFDGEYDPELAALRQLRAMLESIRLATERLKNDLDASSQNHITIQSK
jgi:hypothetical protein